MAQLLKRKYDLIVLRVRMVLKGDSAHVECRVETSHEGTIETGEELHCSLDEFDVPSRLSTRMEHRDGARPRVPERLRMVVEEFVSANGAERPLWIHLMAPYGNLALVPWERDLAQLGVAVLRLPEFVVQPPVEYPQTLTVALCGSVPRAKKSFEVADYLHLLAGMYREHAGRDVTVHIFTDAEHYRRLAARITDDRVVIHNPKKTHAHETTDPGMERAGTPHIRNAWLRWMRDELSGTGVDTLHFVSHGYLGTSRGALALAESPRENTDEQWSRFVGAAELNAFLTSAGAWSVAFTSPTGNYSPFGLRMLWDELGQMRPGAMLLHDPDPASAFRPFPKQLENVPEVLAFLYASRPVAPPVGADYTLFCQPYLVPAPGSIGQKQVDSDSRSAWLEYTSRLGESPGGERADVAATLGMIMNTGISAAAEPLMKNADVAGWLTAAQRFMEQQNWQLLNESRIAQRQGPDSIASKHVDAGVEAMRKIQNVLKNYSGGSEIV